MTKNERPKGKLALLSASAYTMGYRSGYRYACYEDPKLNGFKNERQITIQDVAYACLEAMLAEARVGYAQRRSALIHQFWTGWYAGVNKLLTVNAGKVA